MWKEVVSGIALANLESLAYYRARRDEAIEKDICLFVEKGINGLPFFFYLPVRTFAVFVGLFYAVTTVGLPSFPTPSQRLRLLQLAGRIPFFSILNKLVSSLVLMRIFDLMPLSRGKK